MSAAGKVARVSAKAHTQNRSAALAILWSFAFAAVSLYWGLGGTFALSTLGDGMMEMALAGDETLMILNWGSVVGKILIGLLVLGMVRGWGGERSTRIARRAVRVVGILLTFYGGANALQHVLMLTGTLPIGSLLGSPDAVRWHLFLWDPVWLLGGILFLLASRRKEE